LRIDLCNPDNKIENVDNQDSPYPRLNTYTTSKLNSTLVFGYLAEANKPKDEFLITKESLTGKSKVWIDQDIKREIINSGFVYLTDTKTGLLDYFEVNTKRFPSTGGTNIIFGKPRVYNGKVKLSRYWNANEYNEVNNPDYRKTLYLYIPKNDITKNKTLEDFILKDSKGNYPDEYQIYDYDAGYPDTSDQIASLTSNFVDGSNIMYVTRIKAYENNLIVPYDGVLLEDKVKKISKKYKIIDYVNDTTNTGFIFLRVETGDFNQTIKFDAGSTTIKFCFLSPETDDTFRTVYVKFKSIEKLGNEYKATIEYAKLSQNDVPN
jgi:hypothetical protein